MTNLFAIKLIDFGHALKMPMLIAIAWGLSLQRMNNVSKKITSQRRLIVLAKSGGMDDIEAAFARAPASFNMYILPRKLIKKTAQYFLNNRVSDSKYITSDKDTETQKLEYRVFLKQVLKRFRSLFGCNAILQFNIAYYAERELAAASSEIGIPFLCHYKECLKDAALLKETEIWYRKNIGEYQGWKMSVYNEQVRESLIRSKVVKPWQVETVGCTRLNYSHQIRKIELAKIIRPTVLFFMIQDTACLPYYNGCFRSDGKCIQKKSELNLTWHSVAIKTNSFLLDMAIKEPDFDFIFKGKIGYSKQQSEQLGGNLPKNVTVVNDGTGHKLLEKANVVVGLNTTAIFEAIAAGIPTIIPALLDENDILLKPYLLELGDAVTLVKTSQEFEEALVSAVRARQITRELSSAQKMVLEKYLGNDDGCCGARLRNLISEAVYRESPDLL